MAAAATTKRGEGPKNTQKRTIRIVSASVATPAGKKSIGATIRIGREIWCLPYAEFFLYMRISEKNSKTICPHGHGHDPRIRYRTKNCLSHGAISSSTL